MSKTKFFKDIFSNKTKFKRFVILLVIILIFGIIIFVVSRIGYNKADGISVEPVETKVHIKRGE